MIIVRHFRRKGGRFTLSKPKRSSGWEKYRVFELVQEQPLGVVCPVPGIFHSIVAISVKGFYPLDEV